MMEILWELNRYNKATWTVATMDLLTIKQLFLEIGEHIKTVIPI
jgi:hypothetical protein